MLNIDEAIVNLVEHGHLEIPDLKLYTVDGEILGCFPSREGELSSNGKTVAFENCVLYTLTFFKVYV